MRRHLLLLVCVLSLVTGSTLLALGATVRQPVVPKSTGTGQDLIGLAREFYDAVNVTLATGDTGELDEIVTADLVEHPARPNVGQGRAGLIASLHSRRILFPGLSVVVDELTATGADRVTARVHTEGGTIGSFHGLSIPPTFGDWGPLDLVRIVDGQIVERWGSLADPLIAESLSDVPLTAKPMARTGTMVVSRMRLAPGAVMDVVEVLASELLFVTAGMLHVAGDGQPPRALRSGELIQLPPASTVTVRNQGDVPAVVFTVALWSIDVSPSSVMAGSEEGDHSRHDGPVGQWVLPVEVETLIAINVSLAARLKTGRIILAPDTTVSIAPENRLIVVVEAGSLEIVKQQDVIATKVTHSAGEAVVMESGFGGALRAGEGGAATVLLIEVVPSPHAE